MSELRRRVTPELFRCVLWKTVGLLERIELGPSRRFPRFVMSEVPSPTGRFPPQGPHVPPRQKVLRDGGIRRPTCRDPFTGSPETPETRIWRVREGLVQTGISLGRIKSFRTGSTTCVSYDKCFNYKCFTRLPDTCSSCEISGRFHYSWRGLPKVRHFPGLRVFNCAPLGFSDSAFLSLFLHVNPDPVTECGH